MSAAGGILPRAEESGFLASLGMTKVNDCSEWQVLVGCRSAADASS